MPEATLGRTTRLEGRLVGGFNRGVVRILQTFRFYHVRNERYAAVIWELVGPVLRDAQVALDLGCGPGGITARLQGPRFLVGVDSDRFSLLHSTEPSILRIQARAERLPIRGGSVSIAVAISLVEHISDQSAFFRELARVLVPDGRVVLQIPELRFPIEPHTKWPLLYVWNSSLQTRVLAATGHHDLNMSTTLVGTIRHAEAAGFRMDRVLPIWHHRLARLTGVPMGYFALFRKEGD